MTACCLLGPPDTAHHLPGSPLAQCPHPLPPPLSSSASSLVLPSPPTLTSTSALLSFCPEGLPRHRYVPSVPIFAGPANARRSQQQLPKQFLPTMSPTLVFLHHSGRPLIPLLPTISTTAPKVSFCPFSHPPQSPCRARAALSCLLSAALRVSAPGQAATVRTL